MEFEVHVEDEDKDQNNGKKKKKKKELEKKEVDVTIVKNSLQLVEQVMEAREAGSVPKNMSKFKNVINECLLKADPTELVGNMLPLPKLYLLTSQLTRLPAFPRKFQISVEIL